MVDGTGAHPSRFIGRRVVGVIASALLTTSLANVMAGLGVFLASGLIALLTTSLSPEAIQSWGRRVPFLTGSLIAVVALVIRTRVRETPLFEEQRSAGKTLRAPLREALRRQSRPVLLTVRDGCL